MDWAEIYKEPNRPPNEQFFSFNFCLKMPLRSSNFRFKVMHENSVFKSPFQHELFYSHYHVFILKPTLINLV